MVLHMFNLSAREAEAGRSVWVQGQPQLLVCFSPVSPKNLDEKGGGWLGNGEMNYPLHFSLSTELKSTYVLRDSHWD